MSETVFVTNKSGVKLEMSYAYKMYVFPVDKTVEVPLEAARHIFGHEAADKEPYLAALGFIRLHSELDEGLERLAKFQITSEPPQQDRSLPSAVGVVPLHVEKRAGGKVTQRAA